MPSIKKEDLKKLQRRPDGMLSVLIVKPVEILLLPAVLRMPISANTWTWLTLICSVIGAGLILNGYSSAAALVIYLSLILDGFDGDVARYRKQTSFYGAYLDRILDRISEAILLFAFSSFFQVEITVLFTMTFMYLFHHVMSGTLIPITGLFRELDNKPRKRIDWRFGRDSFIFSLIVSLILNNLLIAGIWISIHALITVAAEPLRILKTERSIQFKVWRHLTERFIWFFLLWAIGRNNIGLSGGELILFSLIDWIIYFARANMLLSLSSNRDKMDESEWKETTRKSNLKFLTGWGPAGLF